MKVTAMRSFLPSLVAVVATSHSCCLGFLAPSSGILFARSEMVLSPRYRAASERSGECDGDASKETRTMELVELELKKLELELGLDTTKDRLTSRKTIDVATTSNSTVMKLKNSELERGMTKDDGSRIDEANKWMATFEGEIMASSKSTLLDKVTTSLTLGAIVSGGTYLFTATFGDLLTRFELVQEWRYVWPIVGILYMADGACALLSPDGDGILRGWWGLGGNNNRKSDRIARIVQVAGGLGTVIGGAYDAFMPVWMTGPNIVTSAGIGQDGAALLCVWTACYVFLNLKQQCTSELIKRNDVFDIVASNLRHGPLLSQIILLAQLYKLGEGSFDELISWI